MNGQAPLAAGDPPTILGVTLFGVVVFVSACRFEIRRHIEMSARQNLKKQLFI